MNRSRLGKLFISLTAMILGIWLLSGFGKVSHEKIYECAGKNDNGMVINREFPILQFADSKLRISRSDIFSAFNYEICDETVSLVSFATQPELCHATLSEIKSLGSSNGSLSKVTGQLELYGAQELHGEYQCKDSLKKY